MTEETAAAERPRCAGITAKGIRCTAQCFADIEYCTAHTPERVNERIERAETEAAENRARIDSEISSARRELATARRELSLDVELRKVSEAKNSLWKVNHEISLAESALRELVETAACHEERVESMLLDWMDSAHARAAVLRKEAESILLCGGDTERAKVMSALADGIASSAEPLAAEPDGECPKCSGLVVRRTAKKTGMGFLGCSRFPRCRWTKSMRREWTPWTDAEI